MISAQVTIHTPHGLHLRPAGELAEEALKYRCRVSLAHGDKEISAKSLLGILSLCIRQDTEITVVCDGMDEQEALEGMVQFIEHLYIRILMKLEGQSQDCPFCVLSGRICKSPHGQKGWKSDE